MHWRYGQEAIHKVPRFDRKQTAARADLFSELGDIFPGPGWKAAKVGLHQRKFWSLSFLELSNVANMWVCISNMWATSLPFYKNRVVKPMNFLLIKTIVIGLYSRFSCCESFSLFRYIFPAVSRWGSNSKSVRCSFHWKPQPNKKNAALWAPVVFLTTSRPFMGLLVLCCWTRRPECGALTPPQLHCNKVRHCAFSFLAKDRFTLTERC